MATYKEQLEVAKDYRLREGQHYRGDCPFCSGRNTYGVRLHNGVLLWGCFKASCDVHGRYSEGLSTEGIKSRLAPVSDDPRGVRTPVPALTSISTHPSILSFLKSNNSLKAFEEGLIDIRYSPTEDRVMFPMVGNVGYTGRARHGVKPKWKKFGDCTQLLTCGNGEIAVVVEDALSACAVGVLPQYTGCSLSGTVLHQNQLISLREYDTILVCLDPDARLKALDLTARLGSRASMRLIPDDLKRFKPEEIEEILNE